MTYNFQTQNADEILNEIEAKTDICTFSIGYFKSSDDKIFEGVKTDNGFIVYNKAIRRNPFNPKIKITARENLIKVKAIPNLPSLLFTITVSIISLVLIAVMLMTNKYLLSLIPMAVIFISCMLLIYSINKATISTSKIIVEMIKSHEN